MQHRLPAFLLPLLASCGWDAPLNPYAAPLPTTITGTVIVDAAEPSDVIVLAFDAANPAPPDGTGRPVTFTTVPTDAFTSDAATGLVSAPFALTNLPLDAGGERTFQIQALLDEDHNFNPLFTALAGATCGDVGGAYLADLTTQALADVTVSQGDLVQDVSVLVAAPFTTQRPAFVSGNPALSKAKGASSALVNGAPNAANLQFYRLEATAVHTDYALSPLVGTRAPGGLSPMPLDFDGPCPVDEASCGTEYFTAYACECDPDLTAPCDTSFTVWMVDDDGDGAIDPYPDEIQAANGLKNVWPRIFLQWAGAPVTVDGVTENYTEIDLDLANNVLAGPTAAYPYPEAWVAENFPLAMETSGLAGPIPSSLAAHIGAPFQMRSLPILWSPVFRHYWSGGTFGADANGSYDLIDLRCTAAAAPFPWCAGPVDASVVPEGLWQLTVVEPDGQTWSLPNEIAWLELPSTAPEEFDPALQGVAVTIAP